MKITKRLLFTPFFFFLLAMGSQSMHAQSRLSAVRSSINTHLYNNFKCSTGGMFKFAGKVEIEEVEPSGSGYIVRGKFSYYNILNFEVRRSFKTRVKVLLDEYKVDWFSYYTYVPNSDGQSQWDWYSTKCN